MLKKGLFIDCLIDQLINWLIDQLIDGLISKSIYWSIDGLIHWLINWFTDWLSNWFINWLIDCPCHKVIFSTSLYTSVDLLFPKQICKLNFAVRAKSKSVIENNYKICHMQAITVEKRSLKCSKFVKIYGF